MIFEAAPGQPAYHRKALTHGETRVLHYLPTNISAREIADELYLSVDTVKTHQRHLYQKLSQGQPAAPGWLGMQRVVLVAILAPDDIISYRNPVRVR